MKALITDHAWPTLDIERDVLGEVGTTIVEARSGDEAELASLAGDVDAILTCWKKVTPAVLDASPECQIVARYGVGLDNIAVEHATGLGIVVTNVPTTASTRSPSMRWLWRWPCPAGSSPLPDRPTPGNGTTLPPDESAASAGRRWA